MIENAQMDPWGARKRRIVAAVAAFSLLGVFFVAPLCLALMLCSMPCCHADASAITISNIDTGACASQCVVRADEAEPAGVDAVAPEKVVDRSAPVVVEAVHFAAAVSIPGIDRDGSSSHRASDASLQVLNSVFRI
jgi:hypothetical protein